MTTFITEKVCQDVEIRSGEYGHTTFWIAYPPHVGALGQESDRISHAWGRGNTRYQALAAAERTPQEKD